MRCVALTGLNSLTYLQCQLELGGEAKMLGNETHTIVHVVTVPIPRVVQVHRREVGRILEQRTIQHFACALQMQGCVQASMYGPVGGGGSSSGISTVLLHDYLAGPELHRALLTLLPLDRVDRHHSTHEGAQIFLVHSSQLTPDVHTI